MFVRSEQVLANDDNAFRAVYQQTIDLQS